jgi:dolichol kinase
VPFTAEYWTYEAIKLASLYLVAFLTGLLVLRWGMRVNYTRKINHFALFFLPMFLAPYFDVLRTPETALATAGLLVLALGVYARPLRARSGVLATMFAGFDRPEDRPHTLWWLISQVVAGYAVILPLALLLEARDAGHLVLIPILINGIGDGLAEPVGVRFGRHAYTVRALHGGRRYTRTLEGSACVLVTGIVVVLLYRDAFTAPQFWTALAVIPPAMTLAEARSPHTWDTPFLFLTGGLALLGVVALV